MPPISPTVSAAAKRESLIFDNLRYMTHRRRRLFLFWIALFVGAVIPARAARPDLVVIVVGDQVRADYLEKYRIALAPGGLRRFLENGAYFKNAQMDHAITKTSPGHVLIGSGLYPSQSGIISNEWFDRTSGRTVSAAEVIPGMLRVELKWFRASSLAEKIHRGKPGSRFVSISLKDRGALLLGGPDQDDAYWWDKDAGGFVSYRPAPAWMSAFNAGRAKSDVSDDLLAELAKQVVPAWHLGKNISGQPDVLTVSFSMVDLVGHQYGPDTAQVRDAFLKLDRAVEELMAFVDDRVGKNVLWVFSSDHGVTPVPEQSKSRGLAAGRVRIDKESLAAFGPVLAVSLPNIYLSSPTVNNIARMKTMVGSIEGVAGVYSVDDVRSRKAPESVRKAFYLPASGGPLRGGDLYVTLKPKYIFFEGHESGTSHGQPTDDDQHVPLGFTGAGVLPSVTEATVSISRVAPTVLKRLGLSTQGLAEPLSIFSDQ